MSPQPYAAWAAVVATALFATYFVDPYIFGFMTLGLAAMTAVIAPIGLAVACFSRTTRGRAKVSIIASIALAAAAVAIALTVLRGFDWA